MNNPGLILMKKAFLFIDGSNFYHVLRASNLLPVFDYASLVGVLRKEYDIQKVLFYDATKDRIIEPKQYSAQQAFHEKLHKSIPELSLRTRKLKYLRENREMMDALGKVSFCKACAQKARQFLADAGLMRLKKEKGIDVLLVADMIKHAFQGEYDFALLATGDADFVPAVELVQQLGKKVVNIHFYSNSATELRVKSDSHILIRFNGPKMELS